MAADLAVIVTARNEAERLGATLRALPDAERAPTLERFLSPPSSPANAPQQDAADGRPPPERPLWVSFGVGPSTMRFGDPALQRLYDAVFRRSP